ncbi:MAG TPA: hypothetical protein ENI23_07000 [bacterium]|nr:hypothetical protein [bacterium]
MLKERVVKISDPYRLKFLFPRKAILDGIVPLYGDDYIFVDVSLKHLDKFPNSVFVAPSGVDLDQFVNIEPILRDTLHYSDKVIEQISNSDNPWNDIVIYHLAGRLDDTQDSESMYLIFKALGTLPADVAKAYFDVRRVNINVIFTSMLTFLNKMESREELRGLANKVYVRDLDLLASRLKGYKAQVIEFLESERQESDLLWFLISLR